MTTTNAQFRCFQNCRCMDDDQALFCAMERAYDMVFKGTAVVQGTGRALVTATGMATEMGAIAGLLEATEEGPTPLQQEVGHIGRVLILSQRLRSTHGVSCPTFR